jgi:hypothetical protein
MSGPKTAETSYIQRCHLGAGIAVPKPGDKGESPVPRPCEASGAGIDGCALKLVDCMSIRAMDGSLWAGHTFNC